MTVGSKWVHNQLVFYDTEAEQRWLDAIGPDVTKFLTHFEYLPIVSADTIAGWSTTLVEAGGGESTVALTDGRPGLLLITTDANEDDGAQIQMTGETFKLDGQYPLYFGVRLKVSAETQSDFIVGLCITDTTLLGGMTDGVYFRKVDGSTDLYLVIEKDSTETTGAVDTVAADTYAIYEFTWDGTYIDAYIDGVLQTRLAVTNLPNDEELTPSIAFLTGAAAAITMTVDWLRVIQINA